VNAVDDGRQGEIYIDRLRNALSSFEALTAGAADARITNIRIAFESAEREAEREWNEQTAAAREAREKSLAVTEVESTALRAALAARYEAGLKRFDREVRNIRTGIASNYNDTVAEARLEREDRLLLANTVAPATIKGFLRDLRRQEQALEQLQGRRAALEQRATAACLRFRVGLPASAAESPAPGESAAALLDRADQQVINLEQLRLSNLMSGARPYVHGALILLLVSALFACLPFLGVPVSPIVSAVAGGGVCLLILVLLGRRFARVAHGQAERAAIDVAAGLQRVTVAIQHELDAAQARFKKAEAEAIERREREIRAADESYNRAAALAQQERDAAAQKLTVEADARRTEIERRHAARLNLAQARRDRERRSAENSFARATSGADAERAAHLRQAGTERDSSRQTLESSWQDGVSALCGAIEQSHALNIPDFDWHAPGDLTSWTPSRGFVANVPFGWLDLDVSQLAADVRNRGDFPASGNGHLRLPAILALPTRGSLLIESAHAVRQSAIDLLRSVIVRILTTLPPGQAHFTIFDPVGLGENFAGLMHLVDYQEALLGGRIWTEREHIESRLNDLTSHMETVIQKYLRNEFETIAAYNAQAGELAEPYRFLVIADYPAGFSDAALERLLSVVRSGARCGVFTLISCDSRQRGQDAPNWDDLREHSMHLTNTGDGFHFADPVLRPYRLVVERPPSEARLTEIMHAVGREAKANLRVEVPFDAIAPRPDEYGSGSAASEVRVAIGRSGAARLQYFRLGHGLAQHALIAGKTGSGKSTLLHVLITNLALWYKPTEIEFYLVDFKKGVEFKTYVTHALPHARAIAIESDREFGLSVLQRIDAEMHRRGELFRAAGVQDLAGYRKQSGDLLPRTLLIVDEFQVFFGEDDRLAQEAGLLLDRLVRQGRAFGIHILLGSQTLAGNIAMARSTLGQMAVRIALQCAEADAQLIMDDSNTAARLLVRPGEAIYNDSGGLVQGNSPFQTSWLGDEQRVRLLTKIAELARADGIRTPPAVVFEGNVPADIRSNPLLSEVLGAGETGGAPLRAWLGEPVAIKEPTCAEFPRQPGAHLLILGQQDRSAMAVMSAAVLSLAAQRSPARVRFVVLDGSPEDRRDESGLAQLAAALPHGIEMVRYRDAGERICQVAGSIRSRLDGTEDDATAIFLVVHGLQRYRVLRRSEDDFSFSSSADGEAPSAKPDQELAFILREGPTVGVHVLAWCDTLGNLERALERSALRDFDNRLLFQMSATDSSHLIDSPEANHLGLNRALLFSEERGVIEKLRPYDVLNSEWLSQVARRLHARHAS
jgi:DNA segregation ATPase FtsK/SpoIIIE-like protein